MARATKGNDAQFTYDFGISIAQSTVNKVARLTGATLSLASAFYALKNTAAQYVDALKENTLRYGGLLSTMQAIEQVQKRILKGQSQFGMEDQLSGMNRLAAAGVDIRENLDWITKAAHATGKSFSEFSGIVASAISGNMQGLVDMGLLTQRAVRMFEKYPADTIMRQQAILGFVKEHKGLLAAVKSDFATIQDQTLRLKTSWQEFLKAIVGKPNDPNSFYGQMVATTKALSDALARNAEDIKKYGFIIGQTLGWATDLVGRFAVWTGRQVKNTLNEIFKITGDFQTQAASLVVWLEFWKLKIIDFFRTYESQLKTLLKMFIAFKALKWVLLIENAAVLSVTRYVREFKLLVALQKKYLAYMGPMIGTKFGRWLQSLAVFLPRGLRKSWVYIGKIFERLTTGLPYVFAMLKTGFSTLMVSLTKVGATIAGFFTASNPIGWIVLAIGALVLLYKKAKWFRDFVNTAFNTFMERIRLIWNVIAWVLTMVRVGVRKVMDFLYNVFVSPIVNFFKKVTGWISDMWDKFKDSTVGKWIDKWIVSPIKKVINFLSNLWSVLFGKKGGQWAKSASSALVSSANAAAAEYGMNTLMWENPIGHKKEKQEGEDTSTSSPMVDEHSYDVPMSENPLLTGDSHFDNSTSENVVNVSNGAIQIVVQKGEDIDERLLAQKIKEVLEDMQRGNIRGGE